MLIDLLGSPTIASKNWVYRQYDHMVQDGTVVTGSDAAVIRINLKRPHLGAPGGRALPSTGHQSPVTKFIAFTTDCNGVYCYLDPFEGGKIAVAEAARNLVCSGARPLAITDCLNFGNPMKPNISGSSVAASKALAKRARSSVRRHGRQRQLLQRITCRCG